MRVFSVIRNKKDGSKFEKGHIIDGIIFDDGITVIRWKSDTGSTSIFNDFEHFDRIHGSKGHAEYDSDIIFYNIEENSDNESYDSYVTNLNAEYNINAEELRDKRIKSLINTTNNIILLAIILICIVLGPIMYNFI